MTKSKLGVPWIFLGLFLAIVTILVLIQRYSTPVAPTAPAIQPMTEQAIKNEVERERKAVEQEERIERAARAAEYVYISNGCSTQFARLTGIVARENGLSPRLLAAVVVSESSAHADAVNKTDVGLMQINTRVWKYTRAELKNPERNMRIGARILRQCINQYGLVEGLHAYNGFGNPTDEYSTAVLTRAGMRG
jgi:soluble lytic murein transglycosylase-like protein